MITEDLNVFLQDFGQNCTAGAVTALGILDMPTQVISDGMVLSTEYALTVRADRFGVLGYKDQINVNGTLYEVRDTMLVDDGSFARLSLTKLSVSNGVFTGDVFVSGVFV